MYVCVRGVGTDMSVCVRGVGMDMYVCVRVWRRTCMCDMGVGKYSEIEHNF
jgi:hypothetical protein